MVYDARPGCCAMCGKAPSSDAESPGSQGARGIVGVGTPTGFRRCAGCRQQDYCSEACQRKHWPSHRQQCKESRGTGEARDAGHPRAMGSKLPALEPARRRQVVANCVIADKLLANLQKRGVQRHASAVDGASQEALLHEATRQWERGQLKSAEHSLRCLAETEPKNLDAKVALARMVTSQGMLQEAEVPTGGRPTLRHFQASRNPSTNFIFRLKCAWATVAPGVKSRSRNRRTFAQYIEYASLCLSRSNCGMCYLSCCMHVIK